MSVVNCRVANIRPQYPNLEMWMAEDKNVYVGRKGVVFIEGKRFPTKDSPFCNPFKIGRDGETREDVLRMYRKYIVSELNSNEELVKQLLNMEGKNLGCWCAPEPCHADVLLELIGEYKNRK